MNDRILNEQAIISFQHRIASHTIAIDTSHVSTEHPDWGTGSLIKINGRYFIATCRHVVKPEYLAKNLRFLYIGDKSLQSVGKKEIKSYPSSRIDKSYPQELPIINRIYSDSEEKEDLVLLELDPSSKKIENYNYIEIKKMDASTPKAGTTVFIMGFSRELAITLTPKGHKGINLYFEATKIVEKNIYDEDFDNQMHFLTEFKADEHSVDPHGLSGCGVWCYLIPHKGEIWEANIDLVGVQSGGYFERSQVYKATRIECLLELLNSSS